MIQTAEQGVRTVAEQMVNVGISDAVCRSKVLNGEAGSRMVVQYSFYQAGNPVASRPILRLIGKFYPDESGKGNYSLLQKLRKALQNSRPGILAVPAVLFYDSYRRLLVQQRIDGILYSDLIGRSDAPDFFRLAGKALAELHSLDISAGIRKRIGDHLGELICPHPERLCDQLPEFRTQIESLVVEIRKAEMQLEAESCPIHRDLHLQQMFYHRRCVWLIDWDLYAKGDPALDVGNFLVYLEINPNGEKASLTAAFLDGYFAERPGSILRRVPRFKALTWLRLAAKRIRLSADPKRTPEIL